MRDLVLFPDVAAAVCSLLNDALGVTTGVKVPNPRPDEFYRVQRVGGIAREVVIDDATIVVESWAPTEAEAEDLAQLARAHLLAVWNDEHAGALLYRVIEVGAPALLPDPVSATPRVTATYQVTARGVSLETAS